VLQAKWYREHTDRIVAKCCEVLDAARCGTVRVEVLPGSLELPLAAQTVATGPARPEAIICIGAILKGDTLHFEMISEECTRGLGEVALKHDIPVISEVLAVENIQQLIDRSGDDAENKGIEAAIAAAEMIAWRRKQRG